MFRMSRKHTRTTPSKNHNEDKRGEPIALADPEIGWTMKPGIYNYRAYSDDVPPIRATVLDDGRRAVSDIKNFSITDTDILFVGCSYTFGYAISDHETMAWKLQARNPNLNISNFGIAGSSPYQFSLLLKRVLPKIKSPKIVIYSYMGGHEIRNMSLPGWVRKSQNINFPYLDLDSENKIVKLKTRNVVNNPKDLVLYMLSSNVYYWIKEMFPGIKLKSRLIMTEVIKEMHETSKQHGAKFYMVMLDDFEDRVAYYRGVESRFGFKLVNCSAPDRENMIVKNQGHPNGLQNSYWANCINEKIISQYTKR